MLGAIWRSGGELAVIHGQRAVVDDEVEDFLGGFAGGGVGDGETIWIDLVIPAACQYAIGRIEGVTVDGDICACIDVCDVAQAVTVVAVKRDFRLPVVLVHDAEVVDAVNGFFIDNRIGAAVVINAVAIWQCQGFDAIGIGTQDFFADDLVVEINTLRNPNGAGCAIPMNLAVELCEISRWQIGAIIF